MLVESAPDSRLGDARTALQHGKHVLLALPAASTAADVSGLTDEFSAAGACLMVGGTLRFLPSQRVLKQRLEAGTLGTLGLLRAHRWNGGGDAAGAELTAADRCRALSVPCLDLANWLFEAPPERVYARAAEPGYLQVHLGFSGGGMALIDVSDDLPPGDGYRSVTVIGSDGAGYADDHRNRNLVFGGGDAGRPRPGRGQPGAGGRVGRVRCRQLRRACAAGCRRRCRRRPAGGRGRCILRRHRRRAAAPGRPL